MTKTLVHSFRSGNRRRTTWQGLTVYSYVTLNVHDGDTVRVTRLSSSPIRAQALKLSVDKGDLRANGVLASTVALWSHTAPETATLEVVGRKVKSLDIWNSWSYSGVDSAWLGHAGIVMEKEGDAHVLRCSDGVGAVSFTDLVVRIEIGRRG